MNPVIAGSAKFIKLGAGGEWERLCIGDDTLRLGYYEVSHDLCLQGDMESIRDQFLGSGIARSAASSHARQVLDFYQSPSDTLWITFVDGFLWWCFAKDGVEFLGQDPELQPHGSRFRRTVSGWSNQDIHDEPLRMSELNGQLTAIARYQGTICEVKAFDYLLRKVNGEDLPEVTTAKTVRSQSLSAIQALMKLLPWREFELLVELIFSQSGWRRIGESGGTQKTVDIELVLPSTGEHAFVQVKSKTDQSQLDDYIERFSGRGESRMFYVYHSTRGDLNTPAPNVILIGPERLSEMVLEAGLFDWLIRKVG